MQYKKVQQWLHEKTVLVKEFGRDCFGSECEIYLTLIVFIHIRKKSLFVSEDHVVSHIVMGMSMSCNAIYDSQKNGSLVSDNMKY